MGYPADRWKIEAYLKVLQQVNSDAFTIAGLQQIDSKNALCMIELGFAPADVLEVIKSLTVENYFQGPLPDEKGRPHDLWVFGKEIENKLIYIKISVFSRVIWCREFAFRSMKQNMRWTFPIRRQKNEKDGSCSVR